MSSSYEGQVFHVLDQALAQRVVVVFCSLFAWALLFLALYSRPTTERVRTKAEQFKIGVRTHRAELATRSVAALHAAFVAYGAVNLVFWRQTSSNLSVQHLIQPSTWPKFNVYNEDALFYACVSCGYFVADLIQCVIQYEEHGVAFVMHALAGLSGCVFCIFTGEGLLYLMLLMLFEISTPFLHMRWWLIDYGYKQSLLYKVNGLILVFTFTLFRLVIGTPVLFKMVMDLHTEPEMHRHDLPMRITFTVAPLTMVMLNTTWGVALWTGFLQTIGVIKTPPAARKKPQVAVKKE